MLFVAGSILNMDIMFPISFGQNRDAQQSLILLYPKIIFCMELLHAHNAIANIMIYNIFLIFVPFDAKVYISFKKPLRKKKDYIKQNVCTAIYCIVLKRDSAEH